MRLCGQYIRGRGADRWCREEQAERERLLIAVADARVRIVEARDRAAQRAADEREDRERERRRESERRRHDALMARLTGRS